MSKLEKLMAAIVVLESKREEAYSDGIRKNIFMKAISRCTYLAMEEQNNNVLPFKKSMMNSDVTKTIVMNAKAA